MAPDATVTNLPLPEGTRLVHIGPHKTGTSALQAAFHAARPALAAQGVHYAGPTRHPLRAAHAVVGSRWQDGTTPPIRLWQDLVREIRQSSARRVMVSSEAFSIADADGIRRIVGDLDPARVQVAVTLRPLARILPSQWQQNVQSGSTQSYDTWLEGVFGTGRAADTFWHRHRHDALIARWAEVVGHERVTVVVVDDRERGRALRAFEGLLGLREGTLAEHRDVANRSMTMPEVEAVRAFNVEYHAEKLGTALHGRVLRTGAARLMKRREPSPAWPRIETPQWALDRASEIGREMVGNIAGLGVRVVGDLHALAEVAVSGLDGDRQPEVAIPPEVAGSLAMAVLVAMRGSGDDASHPLRGRAVALARSLSPGLTRLPGARIVRSLVRRAGRTG